MPCCVWLYPAQRTGADTVSVFDEAGHQIVTHTFEHLRQQSDKVTGKPNLSLADYIKPSTNNLIIWVVFTVSILVQKNWQNEYKAKVMIIQQFWFSL